MAYVRKWNVHPISCLIESEFIQVKEGGRKRGERVNSSEPKKTLGGKDEQTIQDAAAFGIRTQAQMAQMVHCLIPALHNLS